MKTFSSTLNKSGTHLYLPHKSSSIKDTILQTFKSAFNSAFSKSVKGIKATEAELLYSVDQDKKYLIGTMNTADMNTIANSNIALNLGDRKSNSAFYENNFHIDKTIIDSMNWYNIDGGTAINASSAKDKETNKRQYSAIGVVHSLFNPYYGLAKTGIMSGVPLTSTRSSQDTFASGDIYDCSIRRLVNLSRMKDSPLGQARYKYADFMYCKDIGMPNNHLITLRKFATPVGDNIFGSDATSSSMTSEIAGDIGHLVAYFGTEDNKLEDILKYNMHATWRQMDSKIQQLPSQEDDRESPLGLVLNTVNPKYNSAVAKSTNGGNNIVSKVMGKIGLGDESWYRNNQVLYNYDEHKIYEPKNTIQSMYYYEGKLEFNQEFTLVFSYKMRGYDNINPKSAFLDLLANAINVTYRRGSFWGGRREIIGPQPNTSGWNKAQAMIDNAWSKAGGIIESFATGGVDLAGILGMLSDQFKAGVDAVTNFAKGISSVSDLYNMIKSVSDQTGIGQAVKGELKNRLGRPQLYAFNSLLTGDNTGLWHVTIGNPLNPIMVMGNLIMTDCQIQHFGPLGIDDFPTELKVTVTLKHARGRDAVDIQKMYTRGGDAIYIPHVRTDVSKIYNVTKTGTTNEKDIEGKDYAVNIYDDSNLTGFDYIGDFSAQRIQSNMEALL